MEKKTKAMQFAEIKEVIAAVEVEGRDEMVAFLDEQIASLAAKAEKAKERAAARKAEGDELRAVVKSVLTDEVQTIDAIVAQIEGEDVSKAKVTARLSQLVNASEAVKEMVSVEGRKLTAYKLA
jgi:hypothetical protein